MPYTTRPTLTGSLHMKHLLLALLLTPLLGACSDPGTVSGEAAPSGGSIAPKNKPGMTAFEKDHEATSLAACAHAALASGNTPAWDDLMASLRERYKVMHPNADHAQQESDVVKAVFQGKKALEAQGLKDKEELATWLTEKCY
jgi:hypothetical protein